MEGQGFKTGGIIKKFPPRSRSWGQEWVGEWVELTKPDQLKDDGVSHKTTRQAIIKKLAKGSHQLLVSLSQRHHSVPNSTYKNEL